MFKSRIDMSQTEFVLRHIAPSHINDVNKVGLTLPLTIEVERSGWELLVKVGWCSAEATQNELFANLRALTSFHQRSTA